MAHSSLFDEQLNFALLTLAALAVIFRPALSTLLLLALLQILDALLRMPHTTNHWVFTAFVNMTILQAVITRVVVTRTFRVTGGEVFSHFAPLVRVELIILYFFAVFHKLNEGFFTPSTSCATDLLKAQNLGEFIANNPTLFLINAYLTIVVESLIPIFLFFSRTRNLGILCGILFHTVLGYSGYNAFYDFSSMVFASYFLFTHPAFSVDIQRQKEIARSFLGRFFSDFSWLKLVMVLAAALFLFGAVYVLSHVMNTYQTVHLYFFWTLYASLFAALFIHYLLKHRQQPQSAHRLFALPHWSLSIVPVVVFLNGTSPYLGLKTENSYAMFSNLRTEGGTSNHYLVPASIQLFDYQREVVQIVSSTDPGLQQLARENRAMVLFEFRNYVDRKRPEKVQYILNGEEQVYAASDPSSVKALGRNPPLLSKLMKFRTFAVVGSQPCSH